MCARVCARVFLVKLQTQKGQSQIKTIDSCIMFRYGIVLRGLGGGTGFDGAACFDQTARDF